MMHDLHFDCTLNTFKTQSSLFHTKSIKLHIYLANALNTSINQTHTKARHSPFCEFMISWLLEDMHCILFGWAKCLVSVMLRVSLPPPVAPQPKGSPAEVKEEPVSPPPASPAKAEAPVPPPTPEPAPEPVTICNHHDDSGKNHEPHLGPKHRSHNRVLGPPGGKSSVVFYWTPLKCNNATPPYFQKAHPLPA